MIKLFKVSFKFNNILSNRNGRFLSIYNDEGKRINGKVLTNRLFWVKFQHARGGKVEWVKNYQVSVVVADHQVLF